MMPFCGACLCRTGELHTYKLQVSLKTLIQMGHLTLCSTCMKIANDAEVFMKNVKFIQTKLNSLLIVTESDLENMVQCLHGLSPKDIKEEMKHSDSEEFNVERETRCPKIEVEITGIKTEFQLCDDGDLKVDLELIEAPDPPKININTIHGSDETFPLIKDKKPTNAIKEDIVKPKTDLKLVNEAHKDTKVTDKLTKKINKNKRVTKDVLKKIDVSKGVRKKNFTMTERANMLTMYCKIFSKWPEDGSNWSKNYCVVTTAAHFGVSIKAVRKLVKLCKFEETLTRPRKEDVHKDGNEMVSALKKDSEEEYTCPNCPNKYYKMEELLTHLYKLHRRCFECHYCAKLFRNKYTIENHIKLKHAKEASISLKKEKLYPCQICTKPFLSRGAATNHEKVVHSNERPYHCVECDR